MAFDLAATLRRLKPEKRTIPLVRRADHDLPFVADEPLAGPPLLLDTTVYIDVLQGRAPPDLAALLRARHLNHSSVALSELAYALGRLDPAHPGTKSALTQIRGTIDDMPEHRLCTPSIAVIAEAAIVAGIIARLRGLPRADSQPLQNDACLFLQALEMGWVLVSRNIRDIDLIDQIAPGGRFLFYRQLP